MKPTRTLNFTVNGRRRRVRVAPMKRLLDVLREDCGLTGTKEGCGEGECGACTVLLDGVPVNSCLVPAAQAEGARIVTVEGLSRGPALSLLQQAFVDRGGTQCGMCTPGILVTSHALLARTRGRVPSEDEVRVAMAGNLCRCTGYQRIVDAVRAAARLQAKPARKSAPRKRARRTARKAAPKVAPARKSAPKAAPAHKSGRKTARRVAR
jgi:aerobic carbon-monoxide dehydrogenase small subunit